jgi:hypothetical protein
VAQSLVAEHSTVPSAVLHGTHPLRGYPVTWHLTPLRVHTRDQAAAEFLVERADGLIDDPDVWDLAEKDTTVLTTAEASALVRRITHPMH